MMIQDPFAEHVEGIVVALGGGAEITFDRLGQRVAFGVVEVGD